MSFKDWSEQQVKAFKDAVANPKVPQQVPQPPSDYPDSESFTFDPGMWGTGKVVRYFLGGTAERGETSYYNPDGTFSHRK